MDNDSVYLDTCCFIDLVKYDLKIDIPEHRADHVWFCKRLILASIKKDIKVYTSFVTHVEFLHIKDGDKRIITNEVKGMINKLLRSNNAVMPVAVSPQIIQRSIDFQWKHDIKLKPMDSIHISSAIQLNCGEFITTDRNSIKVSEKDKIFELFGLNIIYSARETKILPADYRQQTTEDIINEKTE